MQIAVGSDKKSGKTGTRDKRKKINERIEEGDTCDMAAGRAKSIRPVF